jgi:hypothetical protein
MLKAYIKRDVKKALLAGISLHRGPVGEPGGDLHAGTFSLDPQDIKILSLGTIWNFGKGTRLS